MRALITAKYQEVRSESPSWPTFQPPAAAGKKTAKGSAKVE
jgi:hypothetical protein